MKKIIACILSVVMIFSISACGKKTVDKTVKPSEKSDENPNMYMGVLTPVSQTKVIPSGKGQVITCDYEVGDRVNKGDLLYEIDDNGIKDSLETTKNSITKANITINTAQENVNNLKVYAPATGILHNFSIKTGERVNATKIGEIFDESNVIAVVPFNETQKNQIAKGNSATVVSADMMASVTGKVTRIYDARVNSDDGSVLYNVEISISNPGGLYNGLSVNARVNTASGTVSSPESGNIENCESVSLVSRGSGNARSVYVKDGQKVTKGQLVLEIENTSTVAALQRAKLDRSDLSIKLARLQKNYDDLFVYAPVSGVVTTKTKKLMDNITSNSESVMTISDTSILTVKLNVSKETYKIIKEGMTVPVKLLDDTDLTINGTVTEIGEEIDSGSGKVYPVTVSITNDLGISAGSVSVDFSK